MRVDGLRRVIDGIARFPVTLCALGILLLLGLSSCAPAKDEMDLEIVEIESASSQSEAAPEPDDVSADAVVTSGSSVRSYAADTVVQQPSTQQRTQEVASAGEDSTSDAVAMNADIYLDATSSEPAQTNAEKPSLQLLEGTRATLTPFS